MAPAVRRQVVNLLASIMLAGLLALIAIGLPLLDRALPAERPVPDDQPYDIGGGVTVRLPPGTFVDVTRTRPRSDSGTALFLIGAIRYAVAVGPYAGNLPEAAERLRQRITGQRGYQVTGPEQSVATGTGLDGLQGGYTAPGRGGRYAVFLAGRHVVEVTVSGESVDLGRALPAVEATTRSIRYGSVP